MAEEKAPAMEAKEAPKTPLEEKKPLAETKKPEEAKKTALPEGKEAPIKEKPAPEAKEGEKKEPEATPEAEETTDPKRILFELELEDGSRREVTASEAAQAVALTEKALQVLDDNKKLVQWRQNHLTNLAKKPLHTVLAYLTEVQKGDSDAAYDFLMKSMRQAVAEDDEWQARPEAERIKETYERKMARQAAEMKRLQAEREQEDKATREANQFPKLKKLLDTAISEYHLPDTDEARDLLIDELKKQRDAGQKVSIANAAVIVDRLLEKKYLDWLKKSPADRIRSLRPDLIEAHEAEKLEKAKKARLEETEKSTPAERPDRKEVSHRIPISRWK